MYVVCPSSKSRSDFLKAELRQNLGDPARKILIGAQTDVHKASPPPVPMIVACWTSPESMICTVLTAILPFLI